jgi:hypothetical protein
MTQYETLHHMNTAELAALLNVLQRRKPAHEPTQALLLHRVLLVNRMAQVLLLPLIVLWIHRA